MLEVTGGRWPKNLPIPWAEGEDMSTSRIARGLRIFPYGRNIAAVVSVVMNKDRQDAAQKRREVIRIAAAVAAAVAAAKSSKLSWTLLFVVSMKSWVSCVFVRRPTSPTVLRLVS
jgi:hypothetical protein